MISDVLGLGSGPAQKKPGLAQPSCRAYVGSGLGLNLLQAQAQGSGPGFFSNIVCGKAE